MLLSNTSENSLVNLGRGIFNMESNLKLAIAAAVAALLVVGAVATVLEVRSRTATAPAEASSGTLVDNTLTPSDPNAADHAAIDSVYRNIYQATISGTSPFDAGYYDPDFTSTLPNGNTLTLAQCSAAQRKSTALIKSVNITGTVQSMDIEGDQATVTTSQHPEATLRGAGQLPDGSKLVQNTTGVNTWEKRDGKWVAVSGKITSEHTSINGNPVG